MKNHISLFQISKKMKSVKHLPEWLKQMADIFTQINLIRNALGMTQEQLAQRVGGNQGDIAKLEKGQRKDVQISTLKKVAESLNCKLLIALVPKEELLPFVERKSEEKAMKLIRASSANMAMELQKPNSLVVREQLKELKEELLRRPKSLWD